MTRKKAKKTGLLANVTFRDIFRLGLIAGVWATIAVSVLVGWYALELPSIISSPRFQRQPSIVIKSASGEVIGRYGDLKGNSVTVADLPPHLIYAVLATEDRRFYQHHGVDLLGMARAFAVNLRAGKTVQGGSTITQQLAKNLFLSRERKLKRKIQEALLALWLEQTLSKDEILSAYLNRVYLGSGAYGVDAAARVYFNKSARNLNLQESAVMAGLLKAPSRYAPDNNPGLSAQRAAVVLSAMQDAGYITPEEADSSNVMFIDTVRKPTEGNSVRYFTDWIVSEIGDLIGEVDEDIVVQTTLDTRVQQIAETALKTHLDKNSEEKNITQGAVIVMGMDGSILAMIGGRDYFKGQYNRATQSKRQPGSSFKPIVFLTALEQGWSPDDQILDARLGGRYRPENYKNEYFGDVTLEFALMKSLNTATVRLAQKVGIDNILTTARKLGIRSPLERDMSIALGSSGVPMLELAGAYTVFANGGYSVAPYGISRIASSKGNLFYSRMNLESDTPLFSSRSLEGLRQMMRMVLKEGTGRGANVPFDAAAKTGTSQEFRDAWMAGYSGPYVTLVWNGNDDNTSMKNVTGGSVPGQIWKDIMLHIHDLTPEKFNSEETDSAAASLPVIYEERSAFGSMLRRIFSFND